MKKTVLIGWGSAILALGAMIVGHMGNHNLTWISTPISTFAVYGPNGFWITISMLLSAITLCCLSILISRYQLLGSHYAAHIVPIVIGAAVSGLFLLTAFEETSSSVSPGSFNAIRQQSFHDAGSLLFFNGLVLLTFFAGWLCAASHQSRGGKVMGVAVTSMGFFGFMLLSVPWPKWLGLMGPTAGLTQRVSYLSMWFAIVLLLILASYKQTSALYFRPAVENG